MLVPSCFECTLRLGKGLGICRFGMIRFEVLNSPPPHTWTQEGKADSRERPEKRKIDAVDNAACMAAPSKVERPEKRKIDAVDHVACKSEKMAASPARRRQLVPHPSSPRSLVSLQSAPSTRRRKARKSRFSPKSSKKQSPKARKRQAAKRMQELRAKGAELAASKNIEHHKVFQTEHAAQKLPNPKGHWLCFCIGLASPDEVLACKACCSLRRRALGEAEPPQDEEQPAAEALVEDTGDIDQGHGASRIRGRGRPKQGETRQLSCRALCVVLDCSRDLAFT